MAGTDSATVANAYVQIIPSAKGIKQGVTDVIANEGTAAGTGFTDKFGGALKGIGSALAKTAKVAGAAAVAAGAMITHAAVDAYADYEQLVGGVETLYGDSANAVIENAQNAYKTAGMSANDYMETVTQFSGALLQSVGGDTVRAAQAADMAIRDMSDNANKMGTDIERIQDAYRGFSRGNFTMLDNLALGYGGTKEEMERLLADAEKISGIHYDVSSYSDIVDAIHVVQTEMGITGTTAEEAASTISGSWSTLSASWDNLLVSLAGGGDDVETAVTETFDALMTWLGNLAPVIVQVVQSLFEAIPAAISAALPAVQEVVTNFIRETFGEEAAQGVTDFIETFSGVFERLSEHFGELVAAVTENVMPALQQLFDAAKPLIDEVFPVMVGIVETVGHTFIDVGVVIANFIGAAARVIAGFLPVVTSTFIRIRAAIEGPINKARDAVKAAIDKIKEFFSTKLKFPDIKMPHFKVTGGEAPWGLGGVGKAPSIAIEWYAQGGIIDGAQLIGVGERGPELVWPSYEPYLSKYADAIAGAGGSDGRLVDEVRALRSDVRNLRVYLDTGALVGGIGRQMDGNLGRRQVMAGRGVV